MKKTLLLFIGLSLICKFSFAQFGLTGGINSSLFTYKFNNIQFSNNGYNYEYSSDENTQSIMGVNIGGFYEIKLNKTLYLKPELLFFQKGGVTKISYYIDGYYTDEITSTFNSNYLIVPIDLRMKFGGKVKFLIDAGIYGAYLVSKNYKTSSLISFSDAISYYKFDEIGSTDFGMNLGAGIEFYKFQITSAFNIGLTNVKSSSYETAQNFTFGLNVAYIFGGSSTSSSPTQKSSSPSKSSSGE